MQCSDRCIVQVEVLPDWVVPTHSGPQSTVLSLGDSYGRPVHHSEEQTTPSVLLPVQGAGIKVQSPDWELGCPGQVCLPSHCHGCWRKSIAEIIVVTPFCHSQIWFHPMTKMLVDLPRRLQGWWNLLENSKMGEFFQHVAWKLYAIHRVQGFPETVADPPPLAKLANFKQIASSKSNNCVMKICL